MTYEVKTENKIVAYIYLYIPTNSLNLFKYFNTIFIKSNVDDLRLLAACIFVELYSEGNLSNY